MSDANNLTQEAFDELNESNAALKEQLDAANAQVAELKKAAAAKSEPGARTKINPTVDKPVVPESTFKVGGKKFKFIIASLRVPGFNDGKPLTASEALTQKDVLEYLVKEGSSAIEEVS